MQTTAEMRAQPHSAAAQGGNTALYGSVRMLPASAVRPGIVGYLDLLYKVKPAQ